MKMLKLMKIFQNKKKKTLNYRTFFYTDIGAIQFSFKCSKIDYAVFG